MIADIYNDFYQYNDSIGASIDWPIRKRKRGRQREAAASGDPGQLEEVEARKERRGPTTVLPYNVSYIHKCMTRSVKNTYIEQVASGPIMNIRRNPHLPIKIQNSHKVGTLSK